VSRRNVALATGAAVAVLLLVLAAIALRPQHTVGPGQGVLARKAPPSGSDGGTVGLDDACFSGYRVQAAGRDASRAQHLSLTLTLKSTPADTPGLAAALDHPGCEADVRRLVTSLTGPGHPAGENGLSVFYRTSSGARIAAP